MGAKELWRRTALTAAAWIHVDLSRVRRDTRMSSLSSVSRRVTPKACSIHSAQPGPCPSAPGSELGGPVTAPAPTGAFDQTGNTTAVGEKLVLTGEAS